MSSKTVGRRGSIRRSMPLNRSEQYVKTRQLMADNDHILLIEPQISGVNLPNWLKANPEFVNSLVHKHGALLFRGFDRVEDAHGVKLNQNLPWQPVGPGDFENSAPRHKVAENVYVASTVPKEQEIFLHSDYTQSCYFAEKITFFCEQVPSHGGENPLADTRKILARIDKAVADKLRRVGWQLVCNFHPSLGHSFEQTFWGRDHQQISQMCEQNQIDLQWHDGVPRTIQTRRAIERHPITAEEVWFNHIGFWHIATLPQTIKEQMIAEFGIESMPYNTYYGDGSVIPDEVALHIRQAMLAEKQLFKWQQGDFIVADNILSCHGREPYQGERKLRLSLFNKSARSVFSPQHD